MKIINVKHIDPQSLTHVWIEGNNGCSFMLKRRFDSTWDGIQTYGMMWDILEELYIDFFIKQGSPDVYEQTPSDVGAKREFARIFADTFDCYADTREETDPGHLEEGNVVMAMTVDKFVDVCLNNFKLKKRNK